MKNNVLNAFGEEEKILRRQTVRNEVIVFLIIKKNYQKLCPTLEENVL